VKKLIGFVLTLLMPIILIALGGAVAGLGLNNDWEYVSYAGLGLVGAGLIWGFFLFLWASDGGW
jgi:hypothetical protein